MKQRAKAVQNALPEGQTLISNAGNLQRTVDSLGLILIY